MDRRLLIGVAILLLAPGASGAPNTAEELARGFDLAYNLEHEAAVAMFEAAIAADPDNPAPHRALAAITWMRILFLRGTMTVSDYLGGVTPRNVDMPDPPADLEATFTTHSARAVELSEELVETARDDPEAQYQLGASLGLAASYMATVEGKTLEALKPAKRAYSAHERVLELDPSRKDAMLVVGTYRYLVSTLPLPVRLMARMVGFGGGKEEGIRLVSEAASAEGETRTEAQFGLVLLYNREEEYGAAQDVLHDLRRSYPRNRVVWLEAAATALRDENPALAAVALREGFSMLASDDRVRMPGEEAQWLFTRGATRLLLGRDADARSDLLAALENEPRLWVTGRSHLELGKLADLAGDRAAARTHYEEAREFCDDGRDKKCVDAAKRLRKNVYRRP
jgi:tetratricopeptide (TPR) repeat protein